MFNRLYDKTSMTLNRITSHILNSERCKSSQKGPHPSTMLPSRFFFLIRPAGHFNRHQILVTSMTRVQASSARPSRHSVKITRRTRQRGQIHLVEVADVTVGSHVVWTVIFVAERQRFNGVKPIEMYLNFRAKEI